MTSKVDPERLAQLTAGSQMTRRRKLPFEALNPNAEADKQFRFRTNPYERALFKYVAGLRGESMQSTIRAFAREMALRELSKG